MRILIWQSTCLFGLLVGSACAAGIGIEAPADQISATPSIKRAEKKRDAGDTKALAGLPAEKQVLSTPSAKQPEVKAPTDAQAEAISVGNPSAVEHPVLGKERAKLLAEMNKSLTVELPPAAFLARPEDAATRVKNLALLDAMVLALGYSNEVAASTAHRDSSDYLATASLGPLLPRVDLSYNSGREYSNPSTVTKQPGNQRLPYDMHHRTDRQLFVRQALIDLPSYYERQRQNLLLKSAEHNLSDAQERVAHDTIVSFLKLIELRLAVVLAENYETDLKKLLDYMSARAEAGGSTQADMQRVKGRVINTRSTVIEAQGAYDSGLVEFARLTGVVPSSIVIPESLLPVLPSNFEAAMATAIQNNHELQAALREMESVAQERHAMLGKFAPKLDIELSSVRTYNAGGIAGSDPVGNNVLYTSQNDKRAMLVMSWNLLNGGADRSWNKALESKRLEQEYRAKEVQRKLEESLKVNLNTLHAVGGRIDGVTQEMVSNDLVLAAFNEQLFAANRSLLDVLDAYQRQYNSRTELARLLIAEATASLQMLRNMGQLQEGIAALH